MANTVSAERSRGRPDPYEQGEVGSDPLGLSVGIGMMVLLYLLALLVLASRLFIVT